MIQVKDKLVMEGCLGIQTYKEVTETSIPAPRAIAKKEIIALLSESDQLNLMATLIEQIGISIGLNTPEFVFAKSEFAKIKVILAK